MRDFKPKVSGYQKGLYDTRGSGVREAKEKPLDKDIETLLQTIVERIVERFRP
jgi:hypothetical protein